MHVCFKMAAKFSIPNILNGNFKGFKMAAKFSIPVMPNGNFRLSRSSPESRLETVRVRDAGKLRDSLLIQTYLSGE